MNLHAVRAIYRFEMARTRRTLMQSIISPVISTSLYFVVFGAAIGSRIQHVEGISYGAFIVPGLIMLSLLTQSIANASFGIYFPRFVGTIYELLSAPISYFEIVLAYVGAAATKSIILGLVILATAALFVPLSIAHPLWMVVFLVLTSVTFSLPLVLSILLIGVPSVLANTATGSCDSPINLSPFGTCETLPACIATHCNAYSDRVRDCFKLELSISFCEAGNQ